MKKNLNLSSLSLATALLLAGAGVAGAQTATTASSAGKTTAASSATTKLPGTDTRFIKDVAKASMGEVAMGRLGADKAASAEVKQYAQKMIDDHTKANGELTALASSKAVEGPADANDHDKRNAKLSEKAGAEFDKAFMKQMVADHKKVVKEFEHETKSGSDPDVKAFAEKHLPTIREHLEQAQSIYDGLKGTEPAGTRSTTKTSS